MALFQGAKPIANSTSNTALVRSGHMSPADKWILDPVFQTADYATAFPGGKLFTYQYGGVGMTDVVIPKGRVVGVGASTQDFVTKKKLSTITLPGISTNNNVIGMAPYNFIKDEFQNDRFGGNQPSIITLEYVTLPYMPGTSAATSMDKTGLIDEETRISGTNQMPWGAVIGSGLQEGDYLKATASGRLVKWIKGTDNFCDVVGQVYAVDYNAEPTGWLKWMLWDESARKEDDAFMNRSGSSSLPSDDGYPYDPSYSEGNTIFQQYQSKLITEPSGIPGIHDGKKKAKTEHSMSVTITATEFAFQLKDYAGMPVGNIQDITIDGMTEKDSYEDVTDGTTFYCNKSTGMVMFKAAATGAKTIKYKFLAAGQKAGMDFTGVVGEVHVLLMK